MEKPLKDKKVCLIIAHRNFRDEEYKEPARILGEAGAQIVVASSSTSTARGMLGATVKPDILLNKVNVQDYDAIVFVGGSGASEYWDDAQAHQIAKEALEQGKLLAAICIAPVTLANAGLLKGRKATVFPSEIAKLRAKGVAYSAAEVIQDGNIITANGPAAATRFAQAILDALSKK